MAQVEQQLKFERNPRITHGRTTTDDGQSPIL